MAHPGAAELHPEPSEGRVFEAHRRVRLADASPAGRLRLDALARYLQDVSSDDTADAHLDDDMAWVVRRLLIRVDRSPVFREALTLRTWCSGTGRSWAERRVSIRGADGGRAEAAVLWVHVDHRTGRPLRLGPQFFECYGGPGVERHVSARLRLPPRPPVPGRGEDGPARRAWPLRFADVDLLGHVNNAAYLAAVEEELARRRELRAPMIVEVEYRSPIEAVDEVVVAAQELDRALGVWLCPADEVADADAHAVARVSSDEPGPAGAGRDGAGREG